MRCRRPVRQIISGFRPERPSFASPGRSPGFASQIMSSPERAKQPARDCSLLFRPFRACHVPAIFPGLCPGLSNDAPLGLKNRALFDPTEPNFTFAGTEVRA